MEKEGNRINELFFEFRKLYFLFRIRDFRDIVWRIQMSEHVSFYCCFKKVRNGVLSVLKCVLILMHLMC